MFKIGEKIVCVDDDFRDPNWMRIAKCAGVVWFPKKDRIYTVRALRPIPSGLCTWLEEIKNVELDFGKYGRMEIPFAGKRFRKLVTIDSILQVRDTIEEPKRVRTKA